MCFCMCFINRHFSNAQTFMITTYLVFSFNGTVLGVVQAIISEAKASDTIMKNADKGFVAKELRKKGMRVNAYNESMNKYIKIVTYLKIEWNNVIFDTDTDKEGLMPLRKRDGVKETNIFSNYKCFK